MNDEFYDEMIEEFECEREEDSRISNRLLGLVVVCSVLLVTNFALTVFGMADPFYRMFGL